MGGRGGPDVPFILSKIGLSPKGGRGERDWERGCKFWPCCSFFIKTHNLSRNKFARALANQPISAPHFFNLQQMFLLRVKLFTQGEKRETSTKTCNGTMLRDKLKVFVSRISPPLSLVHTCAISITQAT